MPNSIANNPPLNVLSAADNKVLVRYVLGASDRYNPEPLPFTPRIAVVVGDAKGPDASKTGVYAHSEKSMALYAQSPVYAGWFDGDVHIVGHLTQEVGVATLANVSVSGDVTMVNADVAEDFDVLDAEAVQGGTVVVLGDDGAVSESRQAYDKRVAGVVSGAGDYKPGLVLDRQPMAGKRQPVALMGKVFCKVDAQFGAIEVGDLLTTSGTPGHAMKAADSSRAFGAVIGKALRPLVVGQGLIPVLVALR